MFTLISVKGGSEGLTRPLTMILLSPEPVDGAAGMALEAGFVCLVDFLTPPTGAVVALALAVLVFRWRLLRDARVVLMISSREVSSFPDMLMV